MSWSLAAGVAAAASEGEGEQSILLPAVYDIVWSAVSFAIIFILFMKYVLPRMRASLAERTERIEGGVARAEAMQEEARASLAQYQAKLATARDEAAAIREKAEAEKAQIIAEARREAEVQAAAIHATATSQIAAERAKAAAELRISNSSAWLIINAADQELGFPLLERRVGGKRGGGSALTPEGRKLLRRYSAAQVEVQALLADLFNRHFPEWRKLG